MLMALIKYQVECATNYNFESQVIVYDDSPVVKNRSLCSPWFLYENKTRHCVCGDELNGVLSCDEEEKKVYMRECHCMTYDNKTGITLGTCVTNCILRKSNSLFQMYFKIPSNMNQLNEVMCGERWNRTGRLCGECKNKHYPLAYSYDMRCVNCRHADVNNWLKYISSAFLPLTIFFVFVLVSGISATSPQLEAFIHFAQIISTPANIRMILEALYSNNYPVSYVVCQLIMTLYGIWNLDFFRTVLPHNCLKLSTLQVLALDYVIAVYPLALILLTYIAVDLYDKRLFLLIWIFKPFKYCLKSVDSSMTIKSSILSTFVTFLLLAYGKFLTVSFDLLAFTKVYSPHGKAVGTVLFYDASIDYFGHKHLPYGVLAIVVLFFFNIVPLIFTLIHPLNKCCKGHLSNWPALRICLDSLQGCYKDGTEGTRDCRFFSSLYLIVRILLFIIYGIVKNSTFYPIASILLLFLVALIVLFQPFKRQFNSFNTFHALIILCLAIWMVSISSISSTSLTDKASYVFKFLCIISIIISILPLFYIMYLLLKFIYLQKTFHNYIIKCCKYCQIHKFINYSDVQESDIDESLPHRLEHIGEEEPFHTTRIQYGSIQQRNISAY